MQRAYAAPRLQVGVARSCLRQRVVGIEVGPGLQLRLTLGDAVEAGGHERLRGEPAFPDRGGGGCGGEVGGVGEVVAAHALLGLNIGIEVSNVATKGEETNRRWPTLLISVFPIAVRACVLNPFAPTPQPDLTGFCFPTYSSGSADIRKP